MTNTTEKRGLCNNIGDFLMPRLDIDTTTLEVAGRALALFKIEYPDRITVWAESVEDKLDIKIGSISAIKDGRDMRNHIYFHKTASLMEL